MVVVPLAVRGAFPGHPRLTGDASVTVRDTLIPGPLNTSKGPRGQTPMADDKDRASIGGNALGNEYHVNQETGQPGLSSE